ncbi:MAG: choice-of-anchor J domain-containing protein [Bacteroidetes bacterium]|nr:choice-of-anchor J domain-containing protein [Bacteroidota bacterium]
MPRMTLAQRLALIAVPAMLATAFIGCKKEFDSPPERTVPQGAVITLAQLRALYQGAPVHFSDTAGAVNTVYAVVTADEQDGNLYKNIYIQDHTGAIVMRLLNSGGLYRGDSIRIYLPGCVLSSYQSMLQLDSVNVDNNVVKQATGVVIVPETLSIAQVTPDKQARLIYLSGVEFAPSDTALTWSDAVGQTTQNRNLKDCNGGTIVVRTSGYADYAGVRLPTGKGSLVANVGQFASTMQLSLRSLPEVHMDGPRCGQTGTCEPTTSLTQDFSTLANNAVVNLDCWYNVHTVGSGSWKGRDDGSTLCAEATTVSFDASNETWLVSAPVTYQAGMHLSLSTMRTVGTADGLSLFVSTDFTNGNVAAATWTPLTGVALANGTSAAGTWIASGAFDLAPFLSAGNNFVIGIKYTGSAANTATYRLDNVTVN